MPFLSLDENTRYSNYCPTIKKKFLSKEEVPGAGKHPSWTKISCHKKKIAVTYEIFVTGIKFLSGTILTKSPSILQIPSFVTKLLSKLQFSSHMTNISVTGISKNTD